MRTVNRKLRHAAVAVILACSLVPAGGLAVAETHGPAVIALDPGHQQKANLSPEPVGPDSSETKPKVTGGTTGVVTRKPEHVLTLEVSLLLQEKLKALGYTVVMTRESSNVDISNKERADIANEAQADLLLRIHADGDDSSAVKGISVLYPAESNPYTQSISGDSKTAAKYVLDEMLSATDARSRGTVARADLSGFNWSKVPTALVEMGFMTNPDEDRMLSDPAYQAKLADGMVAGIVRYLEEKGKAAVPQPTNEPLTLLAETALYSRDGRGFRPAGISLSPQQVLPFETLGRYAHIRTWLGELWVPTDRALRGAVESIDREVKLESDTRIYAVPSQDAAPLASLAPQTVHAVKSWQGWLCINTWLGDSWLRP